MDNPYIIYKQDSIPEEFYQLLEGQVEFTFDDDSFIINRPGFHFGVTELLLESSIGYSNHFFTAKTSIIENIKLFDIDIFIQSIHDSNFLISINQSQSEILYQLGNILIEKEKQIKELGHYLRDLSKIYCWIVDTLIEKNQENRNISLDRIISKSSHNLLYQKGKAFLDIKKNNR